MPGVDGPTTPFKRFRAILDRIEYRGWDLLLRLDESRYVLQVQFWAEGAAQRGRKWLLSEHMTDGEVVQTAFKAIITAEEHECREAFKYRGQAVFGPHLDADWLAEQLAAGATGQVKRAG